jgi:hypothetical protein
MGRGSGIVTVFGLFLLFFFFVAFFDRFQLERAGGDDFKVGAALGTGNDLSLVDLFLFDVEIVFALRTQNHKASLPD